MLGGQPNRRWQLCYPLKLHAGEWASDSMMVLTLRLIY